MSVVKELIRFRHYTRSEFREQDLEKREDHAKVSLAAAATMILPEAVGTMMWINAGAPPGVVGWVATGAALTAGAGLVTLSKTAAAVADVYSGNSVRAAHQLVRNKGIDALVETHPDPDGKRGKRIASWLGLSAVSGAGFVAAEHFAPGSSAVLTDALHGNLAYAVDRFAEFSTGLLASECALMATMDSADLLGKRSRKFVLRRMGIDITGADEQARRALAQSKVRAREAALEEKAAMKLERSEDRAFRKAERAQKSVRPKRGA